MPYFTAVLARVGRSWRARDVDVDGAEDLDELADRLRAVAVDDGPVVLVLEREDCWFAVARVEDDDDPMVFVSDADAARSSAYAAALGLNPEGDEEGAVGDLDVLADLGTSPEELAELVGEDAPATGDALVRVAEAAGFADLVESMR